MHTLVRWFYYHLGLHYSQTMRLSAWSSVMFYYHLGLHYSQTVWLSS